MKTRSTVLRTIITLTLCWTISISCLAKVAEEALVPTRDQAITAIEVINQLKKRHYMRADFTDELSSKLFDRYLTSLDVNKNVLLKSDIKEFESYRYTLDDAFKRGDLKPGYAMFNRYRNRLAERLEQVIATLPTKLQQFDYSKDESLVLDRTKQDWPANLAEADEIWRKRLKSAALSLQLAGKKNDEILKLLSKRYSNQLDRIQQLNSEDIFQLYLNTLTQLYDPHTNYLSPRSSENFNINMSLKLEGIGAVLQRDEEYTKVVRLVHAGPADKQGQLQPSDRIIGVGQGDDEIVDVIGWRLDEVVELIRGKKNTKVRLEIIPVEAKSEQETKIIEIVRDTVKLEEQSAKKSVLEVLDDNNHIHKIGVIDVPAFYIDFEALRRGDPNYKSTTADVSRLLDELKQENVSGIIIDLRDNGGGSLREANELSRLFIDTGPTVQIRYASGRIDRQPKTISRPQYEGPMLVLINRLSASASEIFAAAMQDYQRALIVGGQSFGKGTVQSLSPLRQGQLKLTEQKFYRISGDSTQHRGVVPDIEFPPLYDASKVGESALEDALPWDRIAAVRHQTYFPNMADILPILNTRHQARTANDPDFVYLEEQTAYSRQQSEINILSLNETTRKGERAHEKAVLLNFENKRRKAKGLELLSKLEDEDPATDDEQNADSADDDTANDNKEGDIYLSEAGHILVDAIEMFKQEIASRQQPNALKVVE